MNNNNVEEIDLLDLLYRILMQWRLIIACGLIGALLGGAVGCVKSIRNNKNVATPLTYEEQLTVARERLSDVEAEDVERAASIYKEYQKEIDSYDEYLNNSVWVNLDANHVPTLVVDYYIDNRYKVENPVILENNNASSIIQTYIDSILSIEVQEKIAEAIGGTNPEYVKELITISNVNKITNDEERSNNYSNNHLQIVIKSTKKDDCMNVYDIISNRIGEITDAVSWMYGGYDIVETGATYSEEIDLSIQSKRVETNDSMLNVRSSMTRIISELKDNKLAYFNKLTEGEQAADGVANVSSTRIPLMDIKSIAIGLIFAWLLLGAIIVVQYIVSGTLHTKGELAGTRGIVILGTSSAGTNSNKKSSVIDKCITRLFYKERVVADSTVDAEMLQSNAVIAAKKENVKKVHITGSYSDDNVRDVMELISKAYGADVTASIGDSVLTVRESLEKLATAEAVVIVESIGKSKLKDISREVELCNNYGVKILGCVVIQ